MVFLSSPTSSSLSSNLAKHRQRHWLVLGLTVVAVVSLSAIGIFVSQNLVGQVQDLHSHAAPATTLSLTAAQTQVTVGQTFTVNVEANTGANVVKALDVKLQYDHAALQLLDVTKGTWLTQAQEAVKTIDQATGTGFFGLVILPTANPAYVTGHGIAMTATFKALAPANQTAITFNTASSVAAAANERQNVVSSYANLNVAILAGGSGGTTPKQCNENCSNSSECASGLVCNGGHCRRDGNLSNGQCAAPPAAPDNGLHRDCNQYCANDGECANGLKCSWNQCRLPANVTDANCKPIPTSGPTATPAGGSGVQPTRRPTLVPTFTPFPTQVRATVSARIVLDSAPSPTKIITTKTKTVSDFPTTAPITTDIPNQTPGDPGWFMHWLPAILGIVVVGIAALLFGPQLKSLLGGQPSARVVPSQPTPIPTALQPQPPAQPIQTVQPAQPMPPAIANQSPPAQPKVHFGTPVDFEVSSKQSPKI